MCENVDAVQNNWKRIMFIGATKVFLVLYTCKIVQNCVVCSNLKRCGGQYLVADIIYISKMKGCFLLIETNF